jgi:hypothetical protein
LRRSRSREYARLASSFCRPHGFNGHSQDEIRSWRKRDWLLRNAIGVAICFGRDKIAGRNFNKANFRKAEAEIRKILRPE